MAILNEFGTPMQTNKFLDSVSQRYNRPINQSPKAKDIDDLISTFDHATMVGRSRKIYANNGVVRGVINQKAQFVTGQAWIPQPLSKNKEWRELASNFLSNFYRVADVKGFDLQTVIYLNSVAIDRDADAFILLTESKNGYPMIQCIPGHRCGQRDDSKTVTSGAFKGYKIVKGIIQNKQGRAIGYRFLGDDTTGKDDKDVSAENVIHLFDPEYVESSRGICLFGHCLNSFTDMEESTRREMTVQLLMASQAFTEHLNPIDDEIGNTTNLNLPLYETFEDGMIRVYRGGADSHLDPIQANNRPGSDWQAFHDRIERACILGANWSRSMLDYQGASSVDNRIALRLCESSVKDRQSLILPAINRIVTYAIAKAIKNGLLPFDEEWMKFSFSMPAYITADASRIENSTRENLKLGITTMTEICESQGRSLEKHLREKYEEQALDLMIKKEIEEKYKVTLDPLPQESII